MSNPALYNKSISPVIPNGNIITLTAAAGSLNTDTPSGLTKLIQGSANGLRTPRITAVPRNTCVAGRLLLFKSVDSDATKRLFLSKAFVSYTFSTTVDPVPLDFGLSETIARFLKDATHSIWAGLSVAVTDGMNVEAEWGEYL